MKSTHASDQPLTFKSHNRNKESTSATQIATQLCTKLHCHEHTGHHTATCKQNTFRKSQLGAQQYSARRVWSDCSYNRAATASKQRITASHPLQRVQLWISILSRFCSAAACMSSELQIAHARLVAHDKSAVQHERGTCSVRVRFSADSHGSCQM